jgi:hypothetical protein
MAVRRETGRTAPRDGAVMSGAAVPLAGAALGAPFRRLVAPAAAAAPFSR